MPHRSIAMPTGTMSLARGCLVIAALALGASGAALAHGNMSSATAVIVPTSGSGVQGTIKFHEMSDAVHVTGEIEGLTPGKHGFHIHVNGNCSAPDGSSAGGHFSPLGGRHGSPGDPKSHLGDLGNIEADASGKAVVDIRVSGVTLALIGMHSIIDRALVIHADPDDFSEPAGNSGARVGCAVIEQDMMVM